MNKTIKICLTIFALLVNFHSLSLAEKISEKKFYEILEEAKDFYKGIDQGNDCVWDYHNTDSEYFNIRNQKYKFGDITFYSLGCIYGMYNYWSVWMKENTDGTLEPMNFAYPFYIYDEVEGEEDPSKKLGITTTRILCNPTIDTEKMTITTKCLGRGVGDYFDSGIWKYIGHEGFDTGFDTEDHFILIKFQSDGKDDGEIKPVILYDVKD